MPLSVMAGLDPTIPATTVPAVSRVTPTTGADGDGRVKPGKDGVISGSSAYSNSASQSSAYTRRTPVNNIRPFIISTKSFRYATG